MSVGLLKKFLIFCALSILSSIGFLVYKILTIIARQFTNENDIRKFVSITFTVTTLFSLVCFLIYIRSKILHELNNELGDPESQEMVPLNHNPDSKTFAKLQFHRPEDFFCYYFSKIVSNILIATGIKRAVANGVTALAITDGNETDDLERVIVKQPTEVNDLIPTTSDWNNGTEYADVEQKPQVAPTLMKMMSYPCDYAFIEPVIEKSGFAKLIIREEEDCDTVL